MRRSSWGWCAAVLALSMALSGCMPDVQTYELGTWNLEVPGVTAAPVELRLPAKVHPYLEPNGDGERPGKYFLRTRFEVPESIRSQQLTLAIPCCLMSLATLRVDGEEASALEASVLHRYRTSGSHSWRIRPALSARQALELELEVPHTWAQSGWIQTVPRISASASGDPYFLLVKNFNEASAMTGFVTALVTGLLYGVIFLSDRRRVAHGWYAIGTIGAASFPAVMLNLMQGAFGDWENYLVSWLVTFSAAAAVYFVRAYFGLPRANLAWRALPVVAIPIVVLLGGPFKTSFYLTRFVSLAYMFLAIHQMQVYFHLKSLSPPPANYRVLTLVWPVAMVLGGSDLMSWMGFGEFLGGFRPMSLCISAIALVQALSLGTEHMLSLKRADELNAERAQRIWDLQERNREVGLLNDELRHQISARSRSLVDVLSRVAAQTGPVSLNPGDIVSDRYRVVRPIGRGGMGEVYEVTRGADGGKFALKVLTGSVDLLLRARFAREANLIAKVRHENVVSIVDVDISPEGFLFLVMELVDGRSLNEAKPQFGNVPWAVDVLAGIATGLAAIHASGVIHRDLKPGNILVSRDAGASELQVKITDFGISASAEGAGDLAWPKGAATTAAADPTTRGAGSRALTTRRMPTRRQMGASNSEVSLTVAGTVLGTPAYMAPEVLSGKAPATAEADIFSFGVLSVELLTGRRPARKHKEERLDATELECITNRLREVDETLALLVRRCLGPSAEDRPSAAELAAYFGQRLGTFGERTLRTDLPG